MKRNLLSLSVLFLLTYVVQVVAQGTASVAEKVQSWQGERVMVLSCQGTIFAYCEDRRNYEKEPSCAKFSGKTGQVTGAALRQNASGGRLQLTIAMDGSDEKLVLCDDRPLGFFSELATAKLLVGKSVWTKGIRLLRGAEEKATTILNTGKLTVSRVEWGDAATPIIVYFKTDSGQEGTLEMNNITQGYGIGFDQRFHVSSLWNGYPYLDQFYLEDPRKTHPQWSKAVWQTIENGEVAIGMTLEMAQVACGGRFAHEGVVMSLSGGKAGQILRCEYSLHFFKKFVVLDGKVVRYQEH